MSDSVQHGDQSLSHPLDGFLRCCAGCLDLAILVIKDDRPDAFNLKAVLDSIADLRGKNF